MKDNKRITEIIINADDFGISDGVCRGILDLLNAGAISGTTIMTASYDDEFLNKWPVAELSGLAGVHLQLSGGKPVSPPQDIPTLANQVTGEFLPRELLKPEKVNPLEVELEWTRQIEKGIRYLKGNPTHIDSHQGVHRMPILSEIYLGLAKKYRIKVRGGTERSFYELMKSRNIEGSALIIRDWTGRDLDENALLSSIADVKTKIGPGEIIEIVTHPGYTDNYLNKISQLNTAREFDLQALFRIRDRELLAANGLILTHF